MGGPWADPAITNFFDRHSRLTNSIDSAGTSVTNWWNNQGLLIAVSNALSRLQTTIFGPLDHATNSTDANGATVTNTFDSLGRLLTRSFPDLGTEIVGYTFGIAGFTSQTNQLGSNVLNVAFDPLGRKTTEIFPGVSTNSFTYTPAGEHRFPGGDIDFRETGAQFVPRERKGQPKREKQRPEASFRVDDGMHREKISKSTPISQETLV